VEIEISRTSFRYSALRKRHGRKRERRGDGGGGERGEEREREGGRSMQCCVDVMTSRFRVAEAKLTKVRGELTDSETGNKGHNQTLSEVSFSLSFSPSFSLSLHTH